MLIKTKINPAWYAWTLVLAALMPGGPPLAAGEYTSPAAIAGAVSIDAERLIALVARRPDIVL
jgi:hypothetical protein